MISVDRFADICRAVPYRHKGMFYSEVYLFLEACANHGVNLIIESGVKNGMSTRMISSAWPGELISIDRAKVPPEAIRGVDFMHGDSRELIPAIIAESRGRRIGVLIDGPKGAAALALKDSIWQEPEIQLVAIHDLPVAPGCSRHSHNPDFRRSVGLQLDGIMKHEYRAKYPDGPGLAIWEKKPWKL